MAQPLVAQLYSDPGIERVLNLYGPSECTTYSTFAQLPKERVVEPVAPPIGRPISDTRVYVLDERMSPVPVGVTGELYIGGAGVARGYLGRPGLTAERFLPDPFAEVAGARLYRTGDMVRYRADGNLVFVGRRDHQVKLRGHRIELGEIEAVLARHPAIAASVVVVREEAAGEKQLVAYVVPDGPGVTASAVREHAQAHLPGYMVPQVVISLAALPLTANGKVDRRALPAPDRDRAARAADYVAPRDAAEEVLAGIWADVLGLDRVGVTDNFFELGGDSFAAVRVAANCEERLALQIPISMIFRSPTIRRAREGGGAAERERRKSISACRDGRKHWDRSDLSDASCRRGDFLLP